MRDLRLLFLLCLGLCFFSCTQKEQEQEMDCDTLVQQEEKEEWNSLNNLEGKQIAGDLLPFPQEIILHEGAELDSIIQR